MISFQIDHTLPADAAKLSQPSVSGTGTDQTFLVAINPQNFAMLLAFVMELMQQFFPTPVPVPKLLSAALGALKKSFASRAKGSHDDAITAALVALEGDVAAYETALANEARDTLALAAAQSSVTVDQNTVDADTAATATAKQSVLDGSVALQDALGAAA